MARPSQVVVLVEDNHQQQLVFRYLRRVGLEPHAMRFRLPTSGSGEQWVREQFPIELRAYRNRSARAETKLIAVIDADNLAISERLTQFDQKLREAGLELVQVDLEHVARLIARRNIETWILCLNAVEVDEETDYKRTRNEWTELIRPAANRLYACTRPRSVLPDEYIPSLRQGVAELRKLNFGAE